MIASFCQFSVLFVVIFGGGQAKDEINCNLVPIDLVNKSHFPFQETKLFVFSCSLMPNAAAAQSFMTIKGTLRVGRTGAIVMVR